MSAQHVAHLICMSEHSADFQVSFVVSETGADDVIIYPPTCVSLAASRPRVYLYAVGKKTRAVSPIPLGGNLR